MFRALVHKEWKQLRLLRWVGLGLGLALPPTIVLAAELGQRFGRVSGYSVSTLFLEVLPAFLLFLDGLLGLMIAGQAFAGDRAAGTEAFLLERPVRRSSVWWARLSAVVASVAVVFVGHSLCWGAVARLALPADTLRLPLEPGQIALVVLIVAGSTVVGGVLAASFTSSPMSAVLAGLVLSMMPVGLAMGLTGLFPMAVYRRLPIGAIVPTLLLFGFLGCSYLMLCRGEPAGRRRWLRGGLATAVAVAVVPLVFAVSAPLAMRLEAGRLPNGAQLVPSPGGGSLVSLQGPTASGWLLDPESGEKTRFLSPSSTAMWNRDGSRLAVMRWSGALGRTMARPRVDLHAADGTLLQSHPISGAIDFRGSSVWAGEFLVAKAFRSGKESALLILSAESGQMRTIEIDLPYRDWGLLGPTADGRLFILRRSAYDSTDVVLHPLDLENGRVQSRAILEEQLTMVGVDNPLAYFYFQALSPDGRILQRGLKGNFLDLETGRESSVDGFVRGNWLEGRRMAWIASGPDGSSLFVGSPGKPDPVGGSPEPLRTWEDATVYVLTSPDRRRLLVQVWPPDLDDDGVRPGRQWIEDRAYAGQWVPHGTDLRELWIYEPASDTWTDGMGWFRGEQAASRGTIQWAGPQTLAISGPGFVALRDLGDRAPLRFAVGSL